MALNVFPNVNTIKDGVLKMMEPLLFFYLVLDPNGNCSFLFVGFIVFSMEQRDRYRFPF